jgi:hypothetical protein
LKTIGWATSTLIESSEDWVDDAVRRQWPGVLQGFNPTLPGDIDEADLSAIPTLVQIGHNIAAGMDWTKIIGRGAASPTAAGRQ